MATNIKTVKTYQLNGATTDFAIPFEYLARKFVQVTLIGVDRKVLVLNQDYRFATKTLISTTRAWGPADDYQLIEIRRYTSATERLVDFTDGSILRAYDLNISQVQTLHVAEEARDLTADTIGVNNDGNLDARGRRIVNVGDAVESGDAISLGQITRWNDSALNSKNAAKISEDNAKVSETNSKTSEGNSKRSETNASESEGLAKKWAENPRNVPVQGTSEFSAYHHALNSQAAATASQNSAGVSASSATAAKVSEDNAKADADRAEVEADKLGNMNELAAAIEKVESYNVTFKGGLAGNYLSTKDASTFIDMSSAQFSVPVTTWGPFYPRSDIDQKAKSGAGALDHYNHLLRIHLSAAPAWVATHQGVHIGWNESNSNGEASFVNNKGGGLGGFTFRTVNLENTVETGKVVFGGEGSISNSADIRSGYNLVAAQNVYAGGAAGGGNNSARLEANGNIVGQGLYFGMANGQVTVDGDLTGGVWRNWGTGLWGGLHNNGFFAKPPAGVRLFTGRGPDYLEGSVDGTGVGFRWFNSDRRLKEDIKVVRSADDMLNIIRSYIPVSYKYKNTEYTNNRGVKVVNEGKRSRAGFITQDLIRIWPEVVDIMSDGTQSPDPHQIIGGLMLLVKNMDARLQELEGANK